MTRQKDLKRLTRARMSKTGESYTSARAQLLSKKSAARERPAAAPAAAAPDYAKLAGMSDEAVRARTGCDWQRWVEALDHAGAARWTHRAIARHVADTWGLSGWWAQTVTVGYERIKGLREIGQRRSGAYEANRSRTFPVPLAELYRAWADARRRRRWLPEPGLKVRKATADRSLRITWPDGTSLELWFTARGAAKSTVQIQHGRLASQAEAVRLKAWWGERLDALSGALTAAAG